MTRPITPPSVGHPRRRGLALGRIARRTRARSRSATGLRAAVLATVIVSAGACGDASEAAPSVTFVVPSSSGTWFKGNTHAHTTNSDGDSSPEYVARWYQSHGYDFLVLSDHNVFTDPATLAHLTDESFLLIPGEEVTSGFEGASVHVNGLNLPHVVEARRAESLVATIQANVDAIREVDGVPHINHPNFQWSFGADELRSVERDRLLEIWNGHPIVHNEGGGGTPSVEAVWDVLLTAGKRIYGIAVDDAHEFQGEFGPDRVNPGRGWVEVRADALEPAALMESLEEGRFYASTGVVLRDVVVTPERLEVQILVEGDYRYTTRFIGAEGRVLAESTANPAVYELRGDEPYVRARVTDSGGSMAWVQPVFTTNE